MAGSISDDPLYHFSIHLLPANCRTHDNGLVFKNKFYILIGKQTFQQSTALLARRRFVGL